MPPMKDMYGMGFDPRFFALSAFPPAYALELHRWPDAAQLALVDRAPSHMKSVTYAARAIGAARSGKVEQVRKEVEQLQAIQKELEPKKKKEEGQYQGVSEELTIAKAWLAHAEGQHDEAVKLLRSIANKEEGEAEASQGIPAHEMIADMLMEANRPGEALAEYQQALKTDPGRFDSLYGAAHAAELAGKHDKANEYYSALLKNCEGSKSERSELQHAREQVQLSAKF